MRTNRRILVIDIGGTHVKRKTGPGQVELASTPDNSDNSLL
jgi:hypothetical protein